MEKKFKETSIAEDYSRELAKQNYLIGTQHVSRIATVMFHGISSALAAMKNTTVPKAIAIRSIDNSFLAGARVEYSGNPDDPSNPAAGSWNYSWTFYEEDLKGCDIIELATNSLVTTYLASSGMSLYNMKFSSMDIAVTMATLMIEIIIGWLRENVTDSEPAVLTLDGVFKATASVIGGKVEMGIVPDGEMKVLIKSDDKIQE